eukprot:m.74677 g.74677  ORF g.74677 m.74677 type:complete len:146 (+) comp24686_c1_seq2:314-751(+)
MCLFSNIQSFVNHTGDGEHGGGEFFFDAVERVSVFVSDEVDGDTEMAKSTRSANSVQVSFSSFGEIKVDHDVDGLDIDTSVEEIGAHEVTAETASEVVKNAVAMGLLHLGVDVEARISKFCDSLRQQLDTLHAVAENDGLIDLQL